MKSVREILIIVFILLVTGCSQAQLPFLSQGILPEKDKFCVDHGCSVSEDYSKAGEAGRSAVEKIYKLTDTNTTLEYLKTDGYKEGNLTTVTLVWPTIDLNSLVKDQKLINNLLESATGSKVQPKIPESCSSFSKVLADNSTSGKTLTDYKVPILGTDKKRYFTNCVVWDGGVNQRITYWIEYQN